MDENESSSRASTSSNSNSTRSSIYLVRASMRKLKPFHFPKNKNKSHPQRHQRTESQSSVGGTGILDNVILEDSNISNNNTAGLATTINSPATNKILVTSIMENISNLNLNSEFNNGSETNILGVDLDFDIENEEEDVLQVVETDSDLNGDDPLIVQIEGSPPPYTSSLGNISSSIGNSNTQNQTEPNNNNNNTESASNSNSNSNTAAAPSSNSAINFANQTPPNANQSQNPSQNQNQRPLPAINTNFYLNNRLAKKYEWPHRTSPIFALISCTLSLQAICRFAFLTFQYGPNFLVQFLIFSIIFGIPLFLFHLSIGQYLSEGIYSMWTKKISKILQGIGIGLLFGQSIIGIYTVIGLAWIFTFFRDSFIVNGDLYRWEKMQCLSTPTRICENSQPSYNVSILQLVESIPLYFHGVVLGRENPNLPLSTVGNNENFSFDLKFTSTFNLAVVWMLIFVSLSKGLRSYGKVIHGLVIIPIVTLIVFASKILSIASHMGINGSLEYENSWANFFFNSQTWVVAAHEAFFVWSLLGPCIMQISSHNKYTHNIKIDAFFTILITLVVLMLSGILGMFCVSIIKYHGFSYNPSSYESNPTFLSLKELQLNPTVPSTRTINRFSNLLMGVQAQSGYRSYFDHDDGDFFKKSGYQPLRLATEIVPSVLALLNGITTPFWAVIFYMTLILFGLAQQITIWHCIIRGLISLKENLLQSWEMSLTLLVCSIGFVLALPFCTEYGIHLEFYLDYAIGNGWWIMALYLVELVAVFIVRGDPYCGENIVTVLFNGNKVTKKILAPLLSFVWNVILPVAILVLTIATFKNGDVQKLYKWKTPSPFWTIKGIREISSFLQIIPLLIVPFTAFIQTLITVCARNGTNDSFCQRLNQLFRPNLQPSVGLGNSALLSASTNSTDTNANINNEETNEDPPPKYTPPPSYSTATGLKIAKFLRSSMRRISSRRMNRSALNNTVISIISSSNLERSPPPMYSNSGPSTSQNSSTLILNNTTSSSSQTDLCNSSDSSSAQIHNNNSNNDGLPPTSNPGTSNQPGSVTCNSKPSIRRIASDNVIISINNSSPTAEAANLSRRRFYSSFKFPSNKYK